jgi:NADH-quinone oxidoreductase subunit C
MSKKTLQTIQKKFKSSILDSHDRLGDETVIVPAEKLVDLCNYLRSDEKMAFDMLVDVTAVDYLQRTPRFEVVYHLYSTQKKHRLRIRVPLEADSLRAPTVSGIWRAANWAEREVWDMFGIHFDGHPDLRRILMYEEFEGHPLRKDYPIQKSQPRMDLRRKERDAVEEFRHYFLSRTARPSSTPPSESST